MKKLPLFTFIISLYLLHFISNAKETKETPDMIVILTRHGAREPYNSAWDKSWKNSQEVVDAGVEQSYVLGAVLAEAYADLLKDIDMNEVTAYATVKARTEMTVSALLLGLFQGRSHVHKGDFSKKDLLLPYSDQGLVNKVIEKVLEMPEILPNRMQLLHQILTTYKAEKNDTFEPLDCWLIKDSVPKRFNDEVNNAMFAELNDTVMALRHLGYPIINLQELVEDADIMISRFSDNRPPLEGIPYDGKIYKDMIFVLHWWCLYNFIGPEIERSVRVYPLYRNMLSWFNERVSGESKTKVILIGAHESAMFPFLNLHGIVNHTCFHENYKAQLAGKALPYPDCVNPDFASQLIYELYDSNGPNPYVKMLYNGKPFKICPESEGVECSLSEFNLFATKIVIEFHGSTAKQNNVIYGKRHRERVNRLFPSWTSNLSEDEYQGLCVKPGSEEERQAKEVSERVIIINSELEKCQAESAAKAQAAALKLESQKMRGYLPIVTGLLGVMIGLLPYCLGVVKGKKIYEFAKRTGLTLLTAKSPADVLTNVEESCHEQDSGIVEGKQRKTKKEIVDV